MYDTTTGGLPNAGLAEAPGQNREDVERTRDALDDVRVPGPDAASDAEPGTGSEAPDAQPGTGSGGVRRIGRVARRRPAQAVALLLAGAAATAVVLRRR